MYIDAHTHMILSECVYILTYVTRGWLIVTDHGGFTLNHDSKTFRNLNLTYTIAAAIQENLDLWLQEAQQVLGSVVAADGLIRRSPRPDISGQK